MTSAAEIQFRFEVFPLALFAWNFWKLRCNCRCRSLLFPLLTRWQWKIVEKMQSKARA